MKSKSATLEDVARHAGVSYQTVSRGTQQICQCIRSDAPQGGEIDRGITLCAKPAGAAAGGKGESDGRAGDYFAGLGMRLPRWRRR